MPKINYPPGGASIVWSITASVSSYGPINVSISLTADGAATAPDSWALIGPGEIDETAKLSGTATDTVTAQISSAGPWRFEASDSTGVIAISVQTVLLRPMAQSTINELPFELLRD